MNKVTIEITSEGWTTTLYANGRKFAQRWQPCKGGYESIDPPFEDMGVDDEMAEALGDLDLYDIMEAISAIDPDDY